MSNRVFAILFSNASPDVYPDWVSPARFAYRLEANTYGHSVGRASGSEYEVMEQTDEGWRSAWGEDIGEVIKRRWVPHGAHQHKPVRHQKPYVHPRRGAEYTWLCETCGTRIPKALVRHD